MFDLAKEQTDDRFRKQLGCSPSIYNRKPMSGTGIDYFIKHNVKIAKQLGCSCSTGHLAKQQGCGNSNVTL
jgi:hypothetical protein